MMADEGGDWSLQRKSCQFEIDNIHVYISGDNDQFYFNTFENLTIN